MPIYEFYCPDCHVIYNFLSRRVNTEARPDCPRCARAALERKPSLFAISKGRGEPDDDGGMPDLDEARLERAMASMAGDLDKLDEDDPRAMGRVMRELFSATGMKPKAEVEEALSRIEAGEDPEAVQAEMGDVLDSDDLFQLGRAGQVGELRRRLARPQVDPKLYEL